ncbi:MAG: TlpA family protein disulfide reductase [Chloroflexota bacterium]
MHSISQWPRFAALFLALALLLVACGGGQAAAPKVGQPAPDLTLTSLDGQTLKLSELRGKVVLLNFWATYCDPCKAEMPALEKIYKEVRDNGGVVIGVDQKEPSGTVKKFIAEYGLTFPVALDEKGAASDTYAVQYIPTTYVLDKQGVVRYMKVGQMDEPAIRQYFATLR